MKDSEATKNSSLLNALSRRVSGQGDVNAPLSRRRIIWVIGDLLLTLLVVVVVALAANTWMSSDDKATAGVSETTESCTVCDERSASVEAVAAEGWSHQVAGHPYIEARAYVETDEHRVRGIEANGDGWVERMVVTSSGSQVRKGDLLLEVYVPQLAELQSDYLRALDSNDKVSLLIARDRLLGASQSAEQIQQLEQHRQATGVVQVYSPVDGIVSDVYTKEGIFVPDAIDMLAVLDLSSRWLLVELDSETARKVFPGQKAEVLIGSPGKVQAGEVSEVMSLGEEKKVWLARLRFDDEENALHPGEYNDVRIHALFR